MRIKELREAKGLTQEQLATASRCNFTQIATGESNRGVVFAEYQLRPMAEALDCTIGELYDDPIDTGLASLINPDRLDKIMEVLKRSSEVSGSSDRGAEAINQLLKGFDQSLTVAEITMVALSFSEKEIDESNLAKAVEYLGILKALNVPLTTPIKNFTPEQQVMQDSSEGFLQSLNQFRDNWAKANAAAKGDVTP